MEENTQNTKPSYNILIIYNLIITMFVAMIASVNDHGFETMFVLVPSQTALNILLSIIFYFIKRNEISLAFLLSAAVSLLVGFSLCFGILATA